MSEATPDENTWPKLFVHILLRLKAEGWIPVDQMHGRPAEWDVITLHGRIERLRRHRSGRWYSLTTGRHIQQPRVILGRIVRTITEDEQS